VPALRRILSISNNVALLITRNDSLAVAGYSVSSPRQPEDAPLLFRKEHFDAVLIGDSVPPPVRKQVIEELHEHDDSVPIIYVYADPQRNVEPHADLCVDVTRDPEELLKALDSAMRRRDGRAA
jgi:DNA-binding response OmpR family regulator